MLALSLLLAAVACTKEDLSECDVFLRFRYDYNMTGEDLFANQVEQVSVFVFDRDGKYMTTLSESVERLKADGCRMQVPYSMRGCRMVVWAGRTDQFYTLPAMAAGDGIEKLTLVYAPEEQLCSCEIDNLWHSGPVAMSFPEEDGTTQTVSLLRDSNDFDISLTDKSGNSLLDLYKITIKSANGGYDHKNGYLPQNLPISYVPYEQGAGTAKIRALRVTENDDITLSVTDMAGQAVDIGGASEIDLAEYLLETTPAGMAPQEYLDRCYQWDISLIIDDTQTPSLALAININGWVRWFHPTEL